jgi:hypothetical protein
VTFNSGQVEGNWGELIVFSNNYSTLSEMVVGFWDPNDKRESYGSRVNYDAFATSDEYLYYTIRFQN